MLGIGVSHIINLFNPEKVIVAIENVAFREIIAPSLRAAAERNSFRAHFAATELIFHTLDDQLWARGAAALMLRDIYKRALEHVQWLRRPPQCSPSASASSAQAISRMPI